MKSCSIVVVVVGLWGGMLRAASGSDVWSRFVELVFVPFGTYHMCAARKPSGTNWNSRPKPIIDSSSFIIVVTPKPKPPVALLPTTQRLTRSVPHIVLLDNSLASLSAASIPCRSFLLPPPQFFSLSVWSCRLLL